MKVFQVYCFFVISLVFSNSCAYSQDGIDAIKNKPPYATQLANYTVDKGSHFTLCHDFAAYLNRKPPFYYHMDLKPDPQFKDFKLPTRLEEFDRQKAIDIIYQNRKYKFQKDIAKLTDEVQIAELTQQHENDWIDIESSLLKGEYGVAFHAGFIDVNHSGQKNHVLIIKRITPYTITLNSGERENNGYSYSSFQYIPLDDDGYFLPIEKFSLSYSPFYYRGRFYTAHMGFVSRGSSTRFRVTIYEPRVAPFSTEGVYKGQGVCRLFYVPA